MSESAADRQVVNAVSDCRSDGVKSRSGMIVANEINRIGGVRRQPCDADPARLRRKRFPEQMTIPVIFECFEPTLNRTD